MDVTESKIPESTAPAGGFAAMGDRYFAQYLWTFFMSMCGMWVRVTAMGFLVYKLTGDPFQLGMMQFAQVAPEIVLGPLVAAYLDRLDRRKLLLVVQLTYVVCMSQIVVLVATGSVRFWHLLCIAVVMGCAAAFDWPGRMSLVPRLVPRRLMRSAVALNSTAFNGSRVIGPSIGGWMLGAFGVAACFGMTVVGYVPFLIVLFLMPMARRPVVHVSESSPWSDLADGVRYIWNHKPIRAMLSVDLVPVMLGMSYLTMAPAFATDVLGSPQRALGLLLSANGIGALVGSVFATKMTEIGRRGWWVNVGVMTFGVLLVAFGQTGHLWIALAVIAATGCVYSAYGTLNDTLIQTTVDDAYRGRVTTVYSMIWGLSPMGGLLAGSMAKVVGLQWAISLNGLLVVLYVLYLWFGTPMRSVD